MVSVVIRREINPHISELLKESLEFWGSELLYESSSIDVYFGEDETVCSRLASQIFQRYSAPWIRVFAIFPSDYLDSSKRISKHRYVLLINNRKFRTLTSYESISGLALHACSHFLYQEEKGETVGIKDLVELIKLSDQFAWVAEEASEEFCVIRRSLEHSKSAKAVTMALYWEMDNDALTSVRRDISKLQLQYAKLIGKDKTFRLNLNSLICSATIKAARRRALSPSYVPNSFYRRARKLYDEARKLDRKVFNGAIELLRKKRKRRKQIDFDRIRRKFGIYMEVVDTVLEEVTEEVLRDPYFVYLKLVEIRNRYMYLL